MAIEERKCICGCNKKFYGTIRRVYFNAACEARHRRAKVKANKGVNMEIVTAEGQLKVGDKITIIGRSISDDQTTTVKDVIQVDGKEEIIINKRRNKYFITHMLLSGDSWALQVQFNK